MSALCHEGTLARVDSGLEVGDRFRPLCSNSGRMVYAKWDGRFTPRADIREWYSQRPKGLVMDFALGEVAVYNLQQWGSE
jgi:hypothetical protein